jgi:hypothetical protein
VVIVTAFEGPLGHLDAACVLRKPVTPGQVVRAVRKCLETSRA